VPFVSLVFERCIAPAEPDRVNSAFRNWALAATASPPNASAASPLGPRAKAESRRRFRPAIGSLGPQSGASCLCPAMSGSELDRSGDGAGAAERRETGCEGASHERQYLSLTPPRKAMLTFAV